MLTSSIQTSIESQHFTCSCQPTFYPMLARASLLARGRSGPDQRYSSARARNQIAADRITGVQRPGIDQRIREATVADATLISQFAVIHDGEVKFITRPVLVTRPDGEVVIHGSVGDTIGQFHPVEVMASEFRGHFTTLLQSRQIGELGLEDHPIAPETIPPPPVGPRRRNAGEQYQPDLSRLEFELPENPDNVVDADRPRITCLPKACGLEPGVTMVTPVRIATTSRNTAPESRFFRAWLDGARYVVRRNGGFSVTEGGPRFDPQGFEVEDGDVDEGEPFSSYTICEQVSVQMTFLNPDSPEGIAIGNRMREFAEETWVQLALGMPLANNDDDTVSTANESSPAEGKTPEERLAEAIHRASSTGKVFKAAKRLAAQHRVFLACAPKDGSDKVTLPKLSKPFLAVLEEEKGIEANVLMQDMYRTPLKVMRRSKIAMDRDVTFRLDQINLAWSDAHRTYNVVDEPLSDMPLEKAERTLNLMHYFTPFLAALSENVANEEDVRLITRANVHDPKAALEAAKKSKLFCGGIITTGRHAYEMIINARSQFKEMYEGEDTPLVIQCLEEVAEAITSEKGKRFFERHPGNTDIPLHIFNDTAHTIACFHNAAKDPSVHGAAAEGRDVAYSNYGPGLSAHRSNMTDLNQAMSGSGLGKFKETPECAHWFRRPDSSRGRAQRSPVAQGTGGPAKRAKTAEEGTTRLRGGGGMLTYTPPGREVGPPAYQGIRCLRQI